jgi:hypothetical protein
MSMSQSNFEEDLKGQWVHPPIDRTKHLHAVWRWPLQALNY